MWRLADTVRRVSTYRLQLTPEFGFAQAAEAAGYLADLGVTHAYLSPVLEAVPGSMHGYDVTDHARIRGELGGEEGFRAMAKRLRSHGLGIILDIVPNHMAVPPTAVAEQAAVVGAARRPRLAVRDLVRHRLGGAGRPDAAADSGRAALESCLGDLRVEPDGGPDGEPVLRYFDHCPAAAAGHGAAADARPARVPALPARLSGGTPRPS